MLPGCQPLAHLSRHRHVVTGLTLSFTDDHLERQRVVPSNAPNLDHVDLASSMYWLIVSPTLLIW
jgi:hypothetical protein